MCLEQSQSVPAAANGGVDHSSPRHRPEELDDLLDHHGLVLELACHALVSGHPAAPLIGNPSTDALRRDFSPIELRRKRAE